MEEPTKEAFLKKLSARICRCYDEQEDPPETIPQKVTKMNCPSCGAFMELDPSGEMGYAELSNEFCAMWQCNKCGNCEIAEELEIIPQKPEAKP